MTEYLIAFNDEWVPDHTIEELREKSKGLKVLLAEMRAAEVLIFTGGLDTDAPVFSVDAQSWTWPTSRRPGSGPERPRRPAAGRRRCGASRSPGASSRPLRSLWQAS
jgi:hypothetical protein